tara:strand:- start:335 stop:2662 length:2328 start_codon:yes stop_codon:yes gene_type:complete
VQFSISLADIDGRRRRTQAVTTFTSDLQSTLTSILLLPVEVTLRDGGTVADVTVTGTCSVDITSALETASEVLGQSLQLDSEPQCVQTVQHAPSPPPSAPPPDIQALLDQAGSAITGSSSDTGMVIGIALGIVLFLCGIAGAAGAVVCLKRRQLQAKQIEQLRGALEETSISSAAAAVGIPVAPVEPPSPGSYQRSPSGDKQAAMTKMAEQQQAAMDALKAIFMANTVESLQAAISAAEATRLVPAEALIVGRERVKLLEAQKDKVESDETSSQNEDEEGEEGAPKKEDELQAVILQLMGEQQSRLELTERLQQQVQMLQEAQAEMEEENKRLRDSVLSREAKLAKGMEPHEDEQQTLDREANEQYRTVTDNIFEKLIAKQGPGSPGAGTPGAGSVAALYAERDLHLFRLSDDDFQAEYVRLTNVYIADDSPAAVRGMAEMVLTKMGEVLDKPQSARIRIISQAAESTRLAKLERRKSMDKDMAVAAQRARQKDMNRRAYTSVVSLWRGVYARRDSELANAPHKVRTLAKRLQNRQELQLVVVSADAVRKMPPSAFVAMGTGGLNPNEVRAVQHALEQANPPGAGAQNFLSMLRSKSEKLPDYQEPAQPGLLQPRNKESGGTSFAALPKGLPPGLPPDFAPPATPPPNAGSSTPDASLAVSMPEVRTASAESKQPNFLARLGGLFGSGEGTPEAATPAAPGPPPPPISPSMPPPGPPPPPPPKPPPAPPPLPAAARAPAEAPSPGGGTHDELMSQILKRASSRRSSVDENGELIR